MGKQIDNLEEVAKEQFLKMPFWATHIAVRNDGSKSEPCAWLEDANDYVDEDPSTLSLGSWAGSYKNIYWSFFSREELQKLFN